MKRRDPTDEVYRELINRAKRGDADAAKRLVRDLRDVFQSPKVGANRVMVYPIRRLLAIYLRGCLTALVDGTDCSAAFNLSRRVGRPNSLESDSQQFVIAENYIKLRDQGLKAGAALEATSEKFHCSVSQVKKSVTRWTLPLDKRQNSGRKLSFTPRSKFED